MGYFCVCARKSDGTFTGRGSDFYIEELPEEYIGYGIDVSWDTVPGAIGYRLYRRFSDENFGNYEEYRDFPGAGNTGVHGTIREDYWGAMQGWLGNGVSVQPGAVGTGTGISTPVIIDIKDTVYIAEPIVVDYNPLVFRAGWTVDSVLAQNNGAGQLQFTGSSSTASIYFGLRGSSSFTSTTSNTTPAWTIGESSYANYSHTALRVAETMMSTPGAAVLTAIKAYVQGNTWTQGTVTELCTINAEANVNSTFEYYTVTSLIGMRVLRSQTGNYSRVTTSYGIKIADHGYAVAGWQRPTTNYGLYIDDQTGGSTDYAIYTNAGTVRFGGTVYTGTSIIPETVADFGGASNRWNTLWCQSIDCSGFVAAGTYVQAGSYMYATTYVSAASLTLRAGSAPGSPVNGSMYVSSTGHLRVHDGSSWNDVLYNDVGLQQAYYTGALCHFRSVGARAAVADEGSASVIAPTGAGQVRILIPIAIPQRCYIDAVYVKWYHSASNGTAGNVIMALCEKQMGDSAPGSCDLVTGYTSYSHNIAASGSVAENLTATVGSTQFYTPTDATYFVSITVDSNLPYCYFSVVYTLATQDLAWGFRI